LLALQHWHEAPVSPFASIDSHDAFLQPLKVRILRQPLESFGVFRHAHLEITLELIRCESVSTAQNCSPSSIGPREFSERLWILRIVRIAREISRDVNLELAVQEAHCCRSRRTTVF